MVIPLTRAPGAAPQMILRHEVLRIQQANSLLSIEKRHQSEDESKQLQRNLVRLLPELKPRLVEPNAVSQRLPADGLLIEFQRYAPYDPRHSVLKKWGSPRYLALLLAPRGQMKAVDLGPAEALERHITTALEHSRSRVPEASASWSQVAEAVFGPLRSSLAGRRLVLVSPDGDLHRVPFSALALMAGTSRSLPEGVILQTIGSGRDLLPLEAPQPRTTAPLVLAAPTTKGWEWLPSAAKEGTAVAISLRAPLHQGTEAKVALLEQARSPRVIHVASHGYFEAQAQGDPLLASGLVLAGADKARLPSRQPATSSIPHSYSNDGSPTTTPLDDGYLTAKEAARLQLDGTQLVVLSACDTGLGQQRTSGEGVFGLQRALIVAGARSTLLSLWRVPDESSLVFMERFYELLNQGVTPDRAVLQVQEEFVSQSMIGSKPKVGGWTDPYYWAAWQYIGIPSEGMR
jgi:CHAT domain-containing protein